MQHEPFPFVYEIAGCVNGAHVALRIDGEVGRREVQFEAGFTSGGEQLLCDEQILALVSIDPLVIMSIDSGSIQPDAAPEIFRVESSILDEGLKDVGRFVLSGCWGVEEGRLVVRAQIVEGTLLFEPLERVTHVEESSSMSIIPGTADQVVVTRAWSIGTSRGDGYSGTTVTTTTCCGGASEEPAWVLDSRWERPPSAGQPVLPGGFRVIVGG